MSLLSRLIPLNLQEEKAKFMADHSYNPQFVYEEPVSKDELLKYGKPQPNYLELAQDIVDRAYHNKTEKDLLEMEGTLLSKREVEEKIITFLKMHGLENRFSISWSPTYVSRASINADTIKLRDGAEFRQNDLLGMIYHEIGTHALRRINYEKQPWYKKKKQYGLTHDYLRTEEGLAGLHSLLPMKNKMAYKAARKYLTIDFALHSSFSDTWHRTEKYFDDPKKRWSNVFRAKRGISNTNIPGAYTKDLVYFEGILEISNWLIGHNFDLKSLYVGKLSYNDIETIQNSKVNDILLPSFFLINKNHYSNLIREIMEINKIER